MIRSVLAAALLPAALVAQPPAAPATPAAPAAPAPRPSLAEPSLSPDGREIAFASGGDLWTVPAAGGEARLLVADPATESRPLWSPDGRRLAFVSTRTGAGDVYVLDLASGALVRVTHDDAPETLDAWSPDGRWLYLSTAARDIGGMQDVYRVRSTGGTPMPVAADRYASEYWAAPSPDGSLVAVTARGIVSGQWWRHGHSHIDESEIWLVRPGAAAAVASSGTPARASSRGAAGPAPDATPDTPRYTPVTARGAKSAWPMWAPDGGTLYFMSDRGGAENLWAQPVAGGRPAGEARRVTGFTDGRVLWPSAARDGRTIVFERDFGVWRADVATGQASAVPVTLRGAPAASAVERLTLTSGFQELALAPDGRKLAFTARGVVFATVARDPATAGGAGGAGASGAPAPASAGGDAVRVTTAPGMAQGLAWHPDSRRVAYAVERDGRWRVAAYDFATRRETVLTSGGASTAERRAAGDSAGRGDLVPRWAPDGRALAFVRDGRELRVLDVDAAGAPGRERLVATAVFDRPPFADARDLAWSPDGRWIAFAAPDGPRGFTNVRVVPAAGGAARAVSAVANSSTGELSWSPDGRALYFVTGQRTEPGQVARVDLVPRPPRFREDLFRDLFGPATPQPAQPADTAPRRAARDARPLDSLLAAPAGADSAPGGPPNDRRGARPRVRVDFDGIRQRLAFLPVGLDVQSAAVSPDGKQLLLVGAAAGQTNLWTWSLDELAREAPVARQLTSTNTPKADAQWAPDSKEVYFRDGGRLAAVALDTRAVRPVPAQAELDVDFAREKQAVFEQAWTYLRDHFYDERFHGADWDAARARTAPHVAGARTPDELRRVLQLMIGELNASHLGASAPPAGAPSTGRLGVRLDPAAYERDGAVRVREVIPLGPAALAGVRPGDAIVAVDGRTVGPDDDLDARLAYTVGRRVALTLAGPSGARREAALRPVGLAAERRLLYRAWVESRRAYVDSASGGRLGYVHMPDMSAESLAQLYADLDAENQAKAGVVVDVRNNNGGFVNAYALDVFARRPYLTMRTRGRDAAPARAALGQRALERPTVLVTNQHSLSDAEDFAEGYRALGLGKIVGEPTAGWIIYTWNVALVDGTTLRLPRTRITGADGTDMELHPRPVDVPVTRPVGESYTGRDAQLDAAVRVLLGEASAAAGR